MNKSQVEIDRIFLASIDSTKAYVDYNEWTIDPDGEVFQYILSLFAHNYDSVSAKKAVYPSDSFLGTVVPEDPEGMDAFVDVISDEMHELMEEAFGISAGSGLFIYGTVEEQPVIAFFKLNYQSRLACEKNKNGEVIWKKDGRLLPAHTQKEYDYFYIMPYDRKVWMSDMKCIIGDEQIDYMAERILKVGLEKSEKETVKVIEDVVVDTIKECYKENAPKKLFEYRQTMASEAKEKGEIDPVKLPERVFADSPKAKERFIEKSEEMEIPQKPMYVSPKTRRALSKKQKIVTENGIEILVPVEYLKDKDIFEYKQENGMVSIYIHDVNGTLK
ncbi:MAG: nucleoid-associated protein [Lachnospiraceae bacterium]|nr:nucleoid-associated protein [Lachnospiraceae bacterium]